MHLIHYTCDIVTLRSFYVTRYEAVAEFLTSMISHMQSHSLAARHGMSSGVFTNAKFHDENIARKLCEFYGNNGKDRHSHVRRVLYLACKSNESLFPWRAKLSCSSLFRNTHGVCRARRLTPAGLTDKSYINFQDVTSTLKNMRTTLFARQSTGAVFRFVSDQRWGPLGESDIHSNTIRPTIDRSS